MKACLRLLEHGPSGARSPGAQAEPSRKVDARSAWSGAARRAAPSPRAKASGARGKVPLVEPFTGPVLRDVAQDVMDVELAQVDPDETAQLLALLGESTVA